jgi:hypothetical protein
MHESIARAVYKGYARKLQNRPFDVDKHQPAATRAAWLRSLIKSEERDARSVLLEPPRIVGQGKHATLYMLGVRYAYDEEQPDVNPLWVGYSIRARAKNFDVDYRIMPVLVTNHLVQRTMQRLGIEDPPTALRSLRTPIIAATVLGAPDGAQALLPADDGAVIALPDREDASFWALVTFVEEARLRPGQIREANRWGELAERRWHAIADTPQST